MSSDESVSAWIDDLKTGEHPAADRIWNRFYARLLALARRKLRRGPRRVADEEDVVTSAFNSFFLRAQQGQFPQLHDRDDLWHLLAVITEHKALNQARAERCEKRGGGNVRGESAMLSPDASASAWGMQQWVDPEPTPAFAAAMTESLSRLLESLDPDLRQIALLKLEGRTNEEIAALIGRSLPTVERRLKLIRDKWHRTPESS
jgi:DNA-directed RNA polymerase specialized sigma24 family protein